MTRLSILLSALVIGLVFSSCRTVETSPAGLATARVVSDFDSYEFRRVGLVPFTGPEVGVERASVLQSAFYAEFSRSTDFEIVALSPLDLAEIPESEPVRRGWYKPETILSLSRRFSLDAILVGTVTDVQSFSPQRLSLQIDLVAAETGIAIWSSSVHLDGADPGLRASLREEARQTQRDDWEIALLSPRHFARLAAHEIAKLL